MDTCERFISLYIYARENTFSTFKLIDSVSNNEQLTYEHSPAITFQRGSYFLVYKILCGGAEKLVNSDTVTVDVTPPAEMDPDSVSVGADDEIYVGWKPSKAGDAKSYIIYRVQEPKNLIIDTVYGRFKTIYVDAVKGDAAKQAEKYRIAPTDSCNNIAPIGSFHQTIFLTVSQDACAGEVYLKWSKYIGWETSDYDIYYSKNKYSGYIKLGSSQTESFTAKGLENHVPLYFYIRAFKKDDLSVTSSSNRVVITTNFEDSTQLLYLSKVSYIKNTRQIELKWGAGNSHNYDHFIIQRGISPGLLRDIQKVTASNIPDFSYTEISPDSNYIWYYRIIGFSRCGRMVGKSNISNNINLSLQYSPDQRKLKWNAYSFWPTGVNTYELYRTTISHGKVSEALVKTFTSTESEFIDFEIAESDANPGICYYIKAIESIDNPYGYQEVSYSNFVCYTVPPIVRIPNAFVPDGIYNTVFKPVLLYADTVQCKMSVYNRWGQCIADNLKVWDGWDGNLSDGTKAPMDVYFYYIEVAGIDRTRKMYSGSFTLL